MKTTIYLISILGLIPRLAVVMMTFTCLLPATPATAQEYCPTWEVNLWDTSFNCVNDPRRGRATDTSTFRWKNHDYLLLNVGNELNLFNIDDPALPIEVSESNFDYGTVGDSDYDLLGFSICDECRFGVIAHKKVRTVLFDFGTGAVPSFPQKNTSARYDVTDSGLGGLTFKKGTQQYLIASELTATCSANSALFAFNGINSLTELGCLVDGTGARVLIKSGEMVSDVSGEYFYGGEQNATAHIYELVGDGNALTLVHKSSPPGLAIRGAGFSVDDKNMLAASVTAKSDAVTFWNLTNPALPVQIPAWTINERFLYLALRSPTPGSASMLWATAPGISFSTRTYLVKASGPVSIDPEYWTDTGLVHNDLALCTFPSGGALAPDGSVLYLSRYAVHQVFDLLACLGPIAATADVSVNPTPVFPGDEVTATDISAGSVDRWAVWFTEGSNPDGTPVAGTNTPSEFNPYEEPYTVQRSVASNVDYWAHVEVESDELPPYDPQDSEAVIIDRTPTASITVSPSGAITEDTVTLTAVAEGNPFVATGNPYQWQITGPDGATPDSGISTSVFLNKSGQWTFELTVHYEHGASGPTDDPDNDGMYEVVVSANMNVTSVAADFSISPAILLNTAEITLNGGLSTLSQNATPSWAWVVTGPSPTYTSCPNNQICVIPANSLNPGLHTFSLTLTNTALGDISVKERTVTILDGSIQPTISKQPETFGIGQTVTFTIEGVPQKITAAHWNFGGNGCERFSQTFSCNGLYGCDAAGFEYASGGTKYVTVTIETASGSYIADPIVISVTDSGTCDDGASTIGIFVDSFEPGDLTRWSSTGP